MIHSNSLSFSFHKILLLTALSTLISLASFNQSAAQQMVVDDATVVTPRSVQFEGWYGTEESWVQPAFSIATWFEVGPAVIFDTSNGFEPDNWLVELKAIPGDLDYDGYAYGFVFAPVFDFDLVFREFYFYSPITFEFLDGTSRFHVNVGFDGVKEEEWDYGFTSGIRGDFGLGSRLTILSEVFTTNFREPAFQAGLRISVIPDRLELDVTYGEGFRRGLQDYPGFNVGIAITPGALW